MGGTSTGPNDYQASNILAGITQQQYQNYQGMYAPIENQQIAYATNANIPQYAAQQAGQTATNASQAQAQGLQKTIEGQGVTLNPQQQQAVAQKSGLAAGLSKVNAMNNAASSAYDTQTQILTGTPSSTQIGNPANLSQTL